MPTIAPSPTIAEPLGAARARADGHHADPLHGLDHAVESTLGVDLRLIYGLGAPVLLVVGAMTAVFLHPSYWIVGAILVLELCCLGMVVTKLLAMLGDQGEDGDATVDALPTGV